MITEAPILFNIEDQVGKIILNRPEVFNSFDASMGKLLLETLKHCKENEEIRAILITGQGKAFSAGQDIQELLGDNPPTVNEILNERLNPIIKSLVEMDKPIISAVNGVAAGAGLSLALACDICVARSTASFVFAFCNIGLIPDGGITYTLPRLVGWQKAHALFMLGATITASEALDMGMIYQVYNNGKFEKEVEGLARRLAQMPTKALVLTKKALTYAYTSDLEKQLAMEAELQSNASRTADFKEGIQAFAEKRQPNFTGA
jgi:2-(1,2-epoxy-1,2-dihydrophenyl)acetyl-CoA isomerase